MTNLPAPVAAALPEMNGFEPQTWREMSELATVLAKSSIIPRALQQKAGDVLVILMHGRELGLGPMQSLRQVFVVDGKPSLSAALKVGLCLRSKACEYFTLLESTDTKATYETKRVGALGPVKMDFTIEQAKKAGVAGKDNWTKYPAAMLRSRCSSALAEVVYPDVVGNIYDPEELGVTPEAEPKPARTRKTKEVDAEIVAASEPTVTPTAHIQEPKPVEVVAQAPAAAPETPIGQEIQRIYDEPQTPPPAADKAQGEPLTWRKLTKAEWQALSEEERIAKGDITRKQCAAIVSLAKAQGLADYKTVLKALAEDFPDEWNDWEVVDLWQLNSKVASFGIDSLRGA